MKSLKKVEILSIVEKVTKTMEAQLQGANVQSKKYSDDIQSQLAFEVGYLGGVIKTAIVALKEIK